MCWVARYYYPVGVCDTGHQCAIAGKYGQRGGHLPGVPSAAQARVRLTSDALGCALVVAWLDSVQRAPVGRCT